MRIGIPASPAASSTASVLARPPMLPGLMRSFAAPRRAASTAISAEKWISATTGSGEAAHTASNASRSALCGMAMRTTSQPAAASASICARFAATSPAGAFSMDCTTTGAPPPSGTLPTMTRRVPLFGFAVPGIRPSVSSSASNRMSGYCTAESGPPEVPSRSLPQKPTGSGRRKRPASNRQVPRRDSRCAVPIWALREPLEARAKTEAPLHSNHRFSTDSRQEPPARTRFVRDFGRFPCSRGDDESGVIPGEEQPVENR